jgi:hypothetical protein
MTTSTKQLSILQLLGQTVARCVVQGENLLRGACCVLRGLETIYHATSNPQPATFNFG